MHTLTKILLGSLLLASMFFANAYAETVTALQPPNSPQKSIIVNEKNPQFTLTLPSNPTTGYSWFLTSYDANLISLVKHAYIAPNANRPGAGGFEQWTFAVKPESFTAPQITKINLTYARPWNMNAENKKVAFTVVIH